MRRFRDGGRGWASALVAGVAIALGVGAVAYGATAADAGRTIEIPIRYSHYLTTSVTVPRGVPITFVLRNDDPIDHEWIVGDAALHERHRTGTEPVHDSRPTEVTIPALSARTTTVTFADAGTFQYICHLPGHEQFGMVGVVTVVP